MSRIGTRIGRLDTIGVHVSRQEGMGVDVRRREAITVTVSPARDTGRYLSVSPRELWVTDWDTGMADVRSNTKWNVE